MTWKKLELIERDTLMCDMCERMMKDTIIYIYIDDSSNHINEVRCEECYNQRGKIKCV